MNPPLEAALRPREAQWAFMALMERIELLNYYRTYSTETQEYVPDMADQSFYLHQWSAGVLHPELIR